MHYVKVSVKLFSVFSQFSGKSLLKLVLPENARILDAVEALRPEIGDVVDNYILTPDKKLKASCVIMLNQRNIECYQELETMLKDDDWLEIIPPLSGG